MEIIGNNKSVAEMYNFMSPVPGRFIRFFNEKNIIKRMLYGSILRMYEYRQDAAYTSLLPFYHKHCPAPDAKLNILDTGCGTGERTLKIACAFPNSNIVAIDISKKSIEYAQKLKKFLNITNTKFMVSDVLKDDLSKLGRFDLVHNSGNLHHLDKPVQALCNMTAALKEGGLLGIVYVYANFRDMHKENIFRQGLHHLFPSPDQTKERVDFVKSLEVARYKYSSIQPVYKKIRNILYNIKTLGYYNYTKNFGDNDCYDAFGQPCAKYYTAELIKKLMEGSKLPLKLVSFRLDPENEKYRRMLDFDLSKKDIFEQLQILECFNYPNFYHLVFEKKK